MFLWKNNFLVLNVWDYDKDSNIYDAGFFFFFFGQEIVVGAWRVIWFSHILTCELVLTKCQPRWNYLFHSIQCLCPGCPDKMFPVYSSDMCCHRRSTCLRRLCDIFRGKFPLCSPSLVRSLGKQDIWDWGVLLWEVHFALIIHSTAIYWVPGMC